MEPTDHRPGAGEAVAPEMVRRADGMTGAQTVTGAMAEDRLRAALMLPEGETALAQAVLTRLALPRAGILPPILPARVVLASYAGLWLAVAVLGYQFTGGVMGDPVLSLALGEVPGIEVVQ